MVSDGSEATTGLLIQMTDRQMDGQRKRTEDRGTYASTGRKQKTSKKGEKEKTRVEKKILKLTLGEKNDCN